MTITSSALWVSFVLTACGGATTALPASSSPPRGSEAELDGGTPAAPQDTATEGADLKSELAAIGARLQDLTKRLEGARDDVKAEVATQVAELQKRDDELKAQLKAADARVGADAEQARRELRGAIADLERRLRGIADRIRH